MIKLPGWIARHIPDSALAFDVSVIFGGFGLQLITQMGWLLLAVRNLGPDGYGIFVSLTGVTVAIGTFVGWGSASLLVRGAAAEPERLGDWFGHALLAIVITGVPLVVLGLLTLPLLDFGPMVGVHLLMVLAADLLFGRAALLCVNVHMATGRSTRQSSVTVIVGTCRLIAIALASLIYSHLTLTVWAWWYLASTIIAAVICLRGAISDYGWPRWCWMPGTLRDGFAFSAESAVQSALKDLDKLIVLQVLGATVAGYYATAFRVIDTLVMPLYALAYATYGKMFRKAASSFGECLEYALKLLPLTLALGAVAGVAALVGAGLLPLIFGEAYKELPWMVRLFAPMPALLGAYMVGSDAMSACDGQYMRLAIVTVTLGVVLLLAPWALRFAGLEGMILLRLAGATVGVVVVWLLLPWSHRAARRDETPT